MAGPVADVAWYGFKLGFGLFSLVSVWGSAAVKNGAIWARDSAEEKRELAAGKRTCLLTSIDADLV